MTKIYGTSMYYNGYVDFSQQAHKREETVYKTTLNSVEYRIIKTERFFDPYSSFLLIIKRPTGTIEACIVSLEDIKTLVSPAMHSFIIKDKKEKDDKFMSDLLSSFEKEEQKVRKSALIDYDSMLVYKPCALNKEEKEEKKDVKFSDPNAPKENKEDIYDQVKQEIKGVFKAGTLIDPKSLAVMSTGQGMGKTSLAYQVYKYRYARP